MACKGKGIDLMDAPFQPHSATSILAASRIKPSAATLRTSVLGFIVARGERGATDIEIQDALGMEGSTQRPRRVELVMAGLVKDSGTTRKSGSGRACAVWVTA